MLFVVLLGVFVGSVSLCLGAYHVVGRRRGAAAEVAGSARSPMASGLRDANARGRELLGRLSMTSPIIARAAHELHRGGLAIEPAVFLLGIGIAAVSGALVGSVLGYGLAAPFAIAGLALPLVWLRHRQRRRRVALVEQLPEALDMLASAMRAGYSFPTAMKLVGDEMPAPLGSELLRFYDEQRLSLDVNAALMALQDRTASADTTMFVTAVVVHREAGGNLSEVFSNIADIMRARADVHYRIDTLTAEASISARVAAWLPLLAVGAVIGTHPELVQPMLAHPVGRIALAYAAASAIVGCGLLMRIAKVDV